MKNLHLKLFLFRKIITACKKLSRAGLKNTFRKADHNLGYASCKNIFQMHSDKKKKPPSPVKGWKPEQSLYHLYILTYASRLTVRFRHCLLKCTSDSAMHIFCTHITHIRHLSYHYLYMTSFCSATQEWYSDILYWQRVSTVSVSLKRSRILTVSINVFNTDNHILGGINCQLIFLFFLDNLMHNPLCNTFLNLTYILQNIDRYFYTAFV